MHVYQFGKRVLEDNKYSQKIKRASTEVASGSLLRFFNTSYIEFDLFGPYHRKPRAYKNQSLNKLIIMLGATIRSNRQAVKAGISIF